MCLVSATIIVVLAAASGCSRSKATGTEVPYTSPRTEHCGVPSRVASMRAAPKSASLRAANENADYMQTPVRSGRPYLEQIPTLARVCSATNKEWVSISGLCHVLLFYGLGPTDVPSFESQGVALKVLTDEEAAVATFGQSPFVKTRYGLRYLLSDDPVFRGGVGEAHRDQCLATFAILGLPLDTPIHLRTHSCTVTELLSEAVASFTFDQRELAWTTLAFARYLPPEKEWVSRFSERTSFSQLAHRLLKLDLSGQSCAGTHVFQALVAIDNADRAHPILNRTTRRELSSYLETTIQRMVRHQQADGSWDHHWCELANRNDSEAATVQLRILATGHLLEVLSSLHLQRRPPKGVYVRAAEWVTEALQSKEIRPEPSLICPFTHAAKAGREVLRLSETKSQHVASTFHHTE